MNKRFTHNLLRHCQAALLLLFLVTSTQARAQALAWQWGITSNAYAGPNAPAPNNDLYLSGSLGTYANFAPLAPVANPSPADTKSFVGRLNGSTHQWQWVLPFTGQIYQLRNTPDGGLTVVGEFHSAIALGSISLQTTGNHSLFVAHCSSAGQWQWATAAPVTGTLTSNVPSSYTTVATDLTSANEVAVAGVFTGSVSFGNQPPLQSSGGPAYYAARLDGQTGQWLWAVQAPIAGGNGRSAVTAVALAPNGNLLLTGKIDGTASFGTLLSLASTGASNLLVACVNGTTQQWQWATAASHAGAGQGTALALTQTGTVVVAGQVSGSASFGSLPPLTGRTGALVVASLNGNTGQWQWATQTGGALARPLALALTSADDIIVAGDVADTLRIGNLPSQTLLGTGAFVAKLSAAGTTWRWQTVAKPLMRSSGFAWNFASARFISLNAADEPLVSGGIGVMADFGSFSLLAEPVPTAIPDYQTGTFIAKLAATSLAISSPSLAAQTELFPNPAHHSFTARLPAANTSPASATLFNSLGQVVRQQAIPAHRSQLAIDVQGLTPGLYTLRLSLGTEMVSRRVQVE